MGTGYGKQIHAKMDMNKLKDIESCWSTGGRKQHQQQQQGQQQERHQLSSIARAAGLNTFAMWMGWVGLQGRRMAVVLLRKDGTDAFTGRS